MKILVGVPEKNSIDAESALACSNLIRYGHEIEYAHADGRGVYGVAQARIRIAEKALEGGYDRLLMVDSDVIVPLDALRHLLDPPVPVVLGSYPFKDNSGNVVLFKFEKVDGTDKYAADEVSDGRFDVKWGGLGCAMVDVNVFRKLGKPWFHWDERPNGKHTGEDVWFCRKLREAGYTIQADGRVRCGHVGRFVYW